MLSRGRDAVLGAPVLNDRGRTPKLSGGLSHVAEAGYDVGDLVHGDRLTNLHGIAQYSCTDAVQFFCQAPGMVHDDVKALRVRTGLSVRDVAKALGFDTHSKYSYYESRRFKGPLPIDMAQKLGAVYQYRGVEPHELLQLAGLSRQDAIEQTAVTRALKHQPTATMRVLFPSERALTRMFDGIFLALEQGDLPPGLSQQLAQLLPVALAATPAGSDEPTDAEPDQALVERLRAASTDDLWML